MVNASDDENVAPGLPEGVYRVEDWRKFGHLTLAVGFGLIRPGWTLEDYYLHATRGEGGGGYETANLWAVQGAGKSSRMLAQAYWIYKDWDNVLDSVVFRPTEFVKALKSVEKSSSTACILWDDIGVHFPSSKFKTDIKQYEAIDSAWAAIRTKCNVIITSIPLIDRLAKNIRDNLTFEIFIGRNQREMKNRIIHLPGTRTLESNAFKVAVEWPPIRFNLFDVPKDVFKEYWDKRLVLADEALEMLEQTTEGDMEGYTSVLQASKDVGLNPNTLQQMISRGVLRGRKIKGRLCVEDEDLKLLVETDREAKRKKRPERKTVS